MSGWLIVLGYAVLVATTGWPGVLAVAGHVGLLMLCARKR